MTLDISAAFSKILSNVEDYGTKLQTEIETVAGQKLSQEEMLEMQFNVNKYNMMLEAASTISKSMVDELKQMAQRAS